VERLPQAVRTELDRRLIENGFSDYEALSEELREKGFRTISKSGLGRYGKQLKCRVQIGRAREQLEVAGVSAELAQELVGDSTLVVVIDRRNGRARLVNLPMQPADVIKLLKGSAA
jgi:hypothetical protein